jgi:predicted transcriptional regulator
MARQRYIGLVVDDDELEAIDYVAEREQRSRSFVLRRAALRDAARFARLERLTAESDRPTDPQPEPLGAA